MEKKNGLVADLLGFKNGFNSFFGALFKTDEKYDKVANYNNPKHMYDDMLKGIMVVLFIAMILSFGIGTLFHYRLFLPEVKNEALALTLAIVMFILVEYISIKFGIKAFQMLFTGLWRDSFVALVGFVGILGIVGFVFLFRYEISAKAFGGQVSEKENIKIAANGQELAKNVKSSYDDDIKDARATIAKGRKQTWGGKLTPKGEEIVKEGNESLQRLLALKGKELGIKGVADSVYLATLTGGALENQKRISKYGGIIEYVIFALTFLYALFQNLSYRKNKEGIESGEIEVDEQGNLTQVGGQQSVGFSNYGKGNAYLNQSGNSQTSNKPDITAKTETNKIGFKHYEQKGTSVKAPDESQEKKNSI